MQEERIRRRHEKGPGRRKKVIIRSSEGGWSREEERVMRWTERKGEGGDK
jgi:hypothetical protein